MNYKFKRIGKTTLSVLLSLMILISAMMLGSIASIEAKADTLTAGDTIYYSMCAEAAGYWNDPCKHWVYFYGDSGSAWASATRLSENLYSAVVPSGGNWTTIIFTRFNSNIGDSQPDNKWTGKYSQTGNIPASSTGNYYTNLQNDNTQCTVSTYSPAYYIVGRFKTSTATTQGSGNWNDNTPDNNFKFSLNSTTGNYELNTHLSPAALTETISSFTPYFYVMRVNDSGNTVKTFYQTSATTNNNKALNSSQGKSDSKITLTENRSKVENTFLYFDYSAQTEGETILYFDPSTSNVWYYVDGLTDYNINSAAIEHGTLSYTVDGSTATTARKNKTVTITATPADVAATSETSELLYKCDSVTVTGDTSGTTIPVTLKSITDNDAQTGKGACTYTFIMPDENVTVSSVFSTTQYYIAKPESNGNGTALVSVNVGSSGDNHKSFVGTRDSVTFSNTPNADYQFSSWSVVGKFYDSDFVEHTGTAAAPYTVTGSTFSTFTIYPKTSVTATATFVENPGTDWDYYVIYGTSDQGLNTAVKIKYKADANSSYKCPDGNVYYVDIPHSPNSNLFFGVSSTSSNSGLWHYNGDNNGRDNEAQKGKFNSAGSTAESPMSIGYQNQENNNFAKLTGISNSITKVRVYLMTSSTNGTTPDGYKFHAAIRETSSGSGTTTNTDPTVTVYAKRGTTRNGAEKRNDGTYSNYYADSTYVTAADAYNVTNHITTYFDSKVDTYTVKKGTQITITTTVKSALKNSVYVKAFCINGYSYGIIDAPAPGDARRTTSGVYTTTFTIPENTTEKYFEITPIFFYFEDSQSDNKTNEYITFYAEDFVGDVMSDWGNTLSCYAWYTQKHSYELTDGYRGCLGGYPGQPMVYENGSYYMQVPKYLYFSAGTDQNTPNTIQGITLNNYYWDDVHFFYGNRGDKDANCQTYDYDDFIALMEYDNLEDIIFSFKYRNTTDNETSGYDFNGLKTAGNGLDPLVDYYDYAVDIFGNRLTYNDNGVTKYYKESDIYTKINNITTAGSENLTYIVSNGYETGEHEYIGYYATKWYVYDKDGTYVAALPPSAFIFDIPEQYLNNNVALPNDPLPGFLGYTDKDSNATRNALWAEYLKLYNRDADSDGIYEMRYTPAVITYEKAINAAGARNDPGLRNDGRWYFSRKGASVEANIQIQIVDEAGNILVKRDGFEGSSNKGSITQAHAYFTNAEFNGLTSSGSVSQSDTAYFNFESDELVKGYGLTSQNTIDTNNTEQYYKFVGWYLSTSASTNLYSPINVGEEADSTTGRRARTSNATFVARYKPVSFEVEDTGIAEKVLIVNHNPLSTATAGTVPTVHGGTGTTTVSQVVITYNNDIPTQTFTNSSSSIAIMPADLANASTIAVTLTTTPSDSNTSVYDVYNLTGENYTDSTDYTTTYISNNSGTGKTVSADKTTITYTYNYSELFNDIITDPETKTLQFYGDFQSKTVTVNIKYYDRLIVRNSPTTINNTPSTLTIDVEIPEGSSITDVLSTEVVKNIGQYLDNELDSYVIWASQSVASGENGIQAMPNYRVESENGTGDYIFGHRYATYAESNITDPDWEHHTDYCSKLQGESGYAATANEKWITYRNAKGAEIFETALPATGTGDVASITIWAFNRPKKYTITPIAPIAGGKLDTAYTFTAAGEPKTVYGITSGSEDNKFVAYQQVGFYNQRLGKAETNGGSDAANTAIDASVDYLTKYGSIPGYLGTTILAEQNVVPDNEHVTLQEGESLVFDGWYAADKNDNLLYKITSDRTYGFRITTSLNVVACYKKVTGTATTTVGLSLTDNGTDFYAVDGGARVRLNTQFNIYGAQDDNKGGLIKNVGMIYIVMPPTYTDDSGVSHTFTGTGAQATIMADLVSLVKKDVLNGEFAKVGVNSWVISVDNLKIGNGANQARYIEYTYNVDKESNGQYDVHLTNKNRYQFILNMNEADHKAGQKFSAVVAFGAMSYDSNNNGTIDVGTIDANNDGIMDESEWIVSDNYVSYITNQPANNGGEG